MRDRLSSRGGVEGEPDCDVGQMVFYLLLVYRLHPSEAARPTIPNMGAGHECGPLCLGMVGQDHRARVGHGRACLPQSAKRSDSDLTLLTSNHPFQDILGTEREWGDQEVSG